MNEKMNKTLRGVWDSLTDEQKEQAKTCKTPDELALLAGRAGIELPDEALDMVAGGSGCGDESELSEENDKEQTAQTIRLIPL